MINKKEKLKKQRHEFYLKNIDKIKIMSKQYYENHKQTIEFKKKARDRAKKYREINIESIKQKQQKYYLVNKNRILEVCKIYRKEHPEVKKEYYKKHFLANKEGFAKYGRNYRKEKYKDPVWLANERKRNALSRRKRTIKRRRAAIELYGGVCCKCGFTDWRALQFDHTNGGGTKESRGSYNAIKHMKEVVEQFGTGKYQLLCANCNWLKRHENKEYANYKFEYDEIES